MGTPFENLVADVKELVIPQKIASDITKKLSEVTRKRISSYDQSTPMIRDDYDRFGIMLSLEFIDIKRGSKIDVDNPLASINPRDNSPRYWFLSAKAIKLHRDLCESGCYGLIK